MSPAKTTTAVFAVALASASLLAQEPATGSLKFRALKTFKYELPDDAWTPVGAFLRFGDLKLAVQKDGMKMLIDTTGDGRTNGTVKGLKGYTQFRAGKGDERFEYAARFKLDKKEYKFRSSCTLQGKVGDLKVALFDMNNNGRYDDIGEDAIAVGSSKSAAYLGRVVSDGEKVYELKLEDKGYKVTLKPYTGKVGKLDLSDRGGRSKVRSVVVRSDEGFSFNLAGHKAFAVPVGSYRIVAGLVQKGKQTARIRAGEMAALRVEENKLCNLEWGGKITATFSHELSGGQAKVEPSAVKYFGEAGEEYYALTPDLKSPKFTVRDPKTGREIGSFIYSAC